MRSQYFAADLPKKGNGKIFFFFFAADFEVATTTSSLTPTELSATCIRSFSLLITLTENDYNLRYTG